MDKFVCLAVLVIAVVLGSVVVAEAASPIRTVGPKAVVMLKKAGTGISNFLWKNKGAVTTGVVLTTFATNPAPFVEAATTVAATTAGKTVEAVVGGSNAAGFLEYLLLAGLAAVCIAAVYYAVRKVQWRQRLIPIVVFLVLFFVICCCGVAVRADTIGSVPMVEASAGLLNPGWLRIALDVVLVVLLLLPIGG